jgi:sugar O-acyltransferase (sialic acid O-acetyltransferase NeuD family)
VAEVVIVGTGGQAREIHALLEALVAGGAAWTVAGFLDDDPAMSGRTVHGVPVLGGIDWLTEKSGPSVAVGVGASASRRGVVLRIEAAGEHVFPALVHPDASVGPRVELGDGAIVAAGAVLTTDIVVGRHALVNFGCTIGHDASIGEYATVAPGAHISGAVHVEEGADVGTGASVIQGITVGAWSVVGAGAAVVRDVEPHTTVVGVPASVIERREGHEA